MQCEICIQYTGCRRYGGLVCAACAAFFRRNVLHPRSFSCKNFDRCGLENFQILKCQSCRLKKCFEAGMRPDRIKFSSPKSSDDESESTNIPVNFVIFAQVVENLVEVCKEDSEGTLRYLKDEDPEVLEKASVRFAQSYSMTDLSKRTKSWSLVLYRSDVKQEELPLLFQLTVIYFSSVFYGFFDSTVRQKLSTVIESGFRFQELETVCKELISKL